MKRPKELEAWGRAKARERYAEGGKIRKESAPEIGVGGGGGGGGGFSGSTRLPPSYFNSGKSRQRQRFDQESERASGNYKEYYDYLDRAR